MWTILAIGENALKRRESGRIYWAILSLAVLCSKRQDATRNLPSKLSDACANSADSFKASGTLGAFYAVRTWPFVLIGFVLAVAVIAGAVLWAISG